MDEEAKVTVCARCGSQACVGKERCAYDGYPNPGTAQVPASKLSRALPRRGGRRG